MKNDQEIKDVVKNKYAEIAVINSNCGCCGTNSKVIDYSVMQDDYTELNGYVKDADLGLGCGVPTEYAGIKTGNTVVDLGCGAGNDIFVARPFAGPEGKLIGVDFTEEMLKKANKNKEKMNAENVEFRLGEIENLPIDENTADVIISNCVLNLVPDKQKAFSEIYRVLNTGGHFCVSDIVIKGELPEKLKASAEMYAGCVAGAIQHDEYLNIINETGFEQVEVKRTKVIELPDNILIEYLTKEEIKTFRENNIGIFSITVVGYKNLMVPEKLKKQIIKLEKHCDEISDERKELLRKFARYISDKVIANKTVNLTFICTHNSRRSHMSQIWAQTAAEYFNIPRVKCYSGGTEATAFNPRAVKAIRKVGFKIEQKDESDNPIYLVHFSNKKEPLQCFSKIYDDEFNPKKDYAAIMTCSHADENCPTVFGADARFPIRFEDPKEFDDTEFEEEKYAERFEQIGIEMLYSFWNVAKEKEHFNY